MDKDFPRNRWWFRGLFVTLRLRLEGRMHLGNENKSQFILHFARFSLPLTSSKVLTLEKTQIKFGFLLTKSYLCPRQTTD